VHYFKLHKTLHHAAMLWIEHLINKPFVEQLDGVLIYFFFDAPTPVLRVKDDFIHSMTA